MDVRLIDKQLRYNREDEIRKRYELDKKFNRCLKRYNEKRMHGAIGWKTPAMFLKEKMTQQAIKSV